MSSTVINTNVMSLNAQNNLRKSENALATSLSRLSSGLRINSARDDAAGLAISDRFTGQIRGNDQAIRNANDGISLAQVAESALSTVSNDLQRMRELAVQSANDTNAPLDRLALDNEFQQLIRAIGRVASTTEFNTRRLLDGTLTTQVFQTGANQGQTIAIGGVDARNTQLGGTEIVGGARRIDPVSGEMVFDFSQQLGLTEEQIKQGFEVKGAMTINVTTVRDQIVNPPLSLKIDLGLPPPDGFNPDADPNANPPKTNIVTLDDLSRILNSAIERAVAGVEPTGTFGPPDANGNLADSRLKLAQANVSAAIVTRDDGTSTVIIRGAFGTEFELVPQEDNEVQAYLPGSALPATNYNSPLRSNGTGAGWETVATAELNAGTYDFDGAESFKIQFDLGGNTETITIPASALTGAATTIAQIADHLNNRPDVQALGITFSNPSVNNLVITDSQGRGINATSITVQHGDPLGNILALAPAPAPATTPSVATIAGFEPNFPVPGSTDWTAGHLQTLKLNIGGQNYTIDLSTTENLTDIETAIDTALGGPLPPSGITASFDANGNLVLTDDHGRSITNVRLDMYSTSVIDSLPLDQPFNNPQGSDLGRFSMVIGGISVGPVDVSDVENYADLELRIQAAIDENPDLAGVTVTVDNGLLTVTDPDGRRIENTTLVAPELVTIFGNVNDQPIKHTQVNLTQIDITTRERATMALHIIDGALSQISDLRSELGAIQKRFESTVDNLGIYNVNLSASRSRIMDADFAAETAALTRGQILQQAGISTLAQANAGPQAVLALLQN